ncbi:MAG: ISAs1 family transposase [Nitrososphaerota archaeon]
MRATECNTACPSISQALRRVPDPRQRRGQRYAWETLLLLICAAVVSGQQTGAAIAQWIGEHAAEWQDWVPTACGRIPSAATVRRALREVEVTAVETALGDWVAAHLRPVTGDGVLRAVALDGKAVRGAHLHGAKVHLVSMVTHAQTLTLGQVAVEAKSNEIPAVQRLLAGRDLRGWVVTLDAMHTQRATAELILRQGGHYLMVVKANQPTLYATLAEWFATAAIAPEAEREATRVEKAHGRLERRALRGRRLLRCGQVDWLDFPGARQGLARKCSARLLGSGGSGRERVAVTYALTSLTPEQASLADLAALWRGHWTIENRSHYVRDVTCQEDAGQARCGATPQMLAALRNLALACFRLAGWTNMAAAFRHTGSAVARAFTLLGYPSPCPPRL